MAMLRIALINVVLIGDAAFDSARPAENAQMSCPVARRPDVILNFCAMVALGSHQVNSPFCRKP